jgi:hypothetical protein
MFSKSLPDVSRQAILGQRDKMLSECQVFGTSWTAVSYLDTHFPHSDLSWYYSDAPANAVKVPKTDHNNVIASRRLFIVHGHRFIRHYAAHTAGQMSLNKKKNRTIQTLDSD